MNVTVRPLTADDVEAAAEVQSRSFDDVDRRFGEPVSEATPASTARRQRRIAHLLHHDPGGAFVACLDERLVGAALALQRGDLWGLSLLAIEPELQGHGIGRQLLAATLRYADGLGIGIILSSRDPRALAAYADAGFDLHPQIAFIGAIDRQRLPAPSARVRADADADLVESLDRAVRGAPRGPDHAQLAEDGPSYAINDSAGRGYAFMRDGFVSALAASDDETATALLWACLADFDGEVRVGHVTGLQQWAVRVAAAARLRVIPDGAAFWRGRRPPPVYLPNGAYL